MRPDYDIVVIGAGIQGSGVAQAAAAGGYRVLVLEQDAPASGTSSRSSKLIHGGLRYLESAQFGLVRKSLKEQKLLLDIAPGLVSLQSFYVPVYRYTKRRPWKIFIGLCLYALLGGLGRNNLFRRIQEPDWPILNGLKLTGLQTVFCYKDAQTDDVALTRAVLASAQELGVELNCPASFLSAQIFEDYVELEFEHENKINSISSYAVINAAGPWVNQVLSKIKPGILSLDVDFVQGTHLVLDCPSPTGVFYVEAPQDGRAIFILPWKGKTMIGTTETLYTGEPAEVVPLQEEIDYLLTVWHHYFETGPTVVLEKFAGLRVLPRTTSSLFHRVRDTVLYNSPDSPRVLTLYGGKLTAYRATALEVMEKIKPVLPAVEARADTASLRLIRY